MGSMQSFVLYEAIVPLVFFLISVLMFEIAHTLPPSLFVMGLEEEL